MDDQHDVRIEASADLAAGGAPWLAAASALPSRVLAALRLRAPSRAGAGTAPVRMRPADRFVDGLDGMRSFGDPRR